MSQQMIGFFCGTGLEFRGSFYDRSARHISNTIDQLRSKLYFYDGCHTKGGGMFAFGVEEHADAFIAEVKKIPSNETIQLNLIGHSRGALSALFVIKKIQADPELKKRVSITAELRDPVPGNFHWTTRMFAGFAIANTVRDLSDCDVVKKVYITLLEGANLPVAFDALVPKFHHDTHVEIETLPGHHDVLQRSRYNSVQEHAALFPLGCVKTLSILTKDGHQLIETYKENECQKYTELCNWVKSRNSKFEERSLFFGEKITANNYVLKEVDAINARHATLQNLWPKHVLYGTNHIYYNYRKSLRERYCDLTMALDAYLAIHPDKQAFVENLRSLGEQFCKGKITFENYQGACKQLLGACQSKALHAATNALCLEHYFSNLSQVIEQGDFKDPLLNNLKRLRVALLQELDVQIQRGYPMAALEKANPVQIAQNTVFYLKAIQETTPHQDIINLSKQYVEENISLAGGRSLGSKVILGAVLSLTATLVGLVLGALIGAAIGLALGLISGPGVAATTLLGVFLGAYKGIIAGAFIGTMIGLSNGMADSYHFFRPSATEQCLEVIAAEAEKNSLLLC